jgi:hypothetical protein
VASKNLGVGLKGRRLSAGSHLKSSRIIRNHQVPGEPLAPRRGIPSGRGLRTTCWRQGSGADGLPFICPFPSAIAEGRRLALPPDGRRRPLQAPHTVPTERCWTPAGRQIERPGSLKVLGSVPAQHPPRTPALNIMIEGSGILTRGCICVHGLHFVVF